MVAKRVPLQRATPERLAKADKAAIGADQVQRVQEGPLAWLASRRFLDRRNPERNQALADAGEEYRRHWYLSGLSPIAAMDPTRPPVRGESMPPGFMPATERQAYHRQQYRRGEEALGMFFSVVVNAVVLEERSLEDVGKQVSRYSNAKLCRAIALDRLIEGLRLLAEEYGFISKGLTRYPLNETIVAR